MQGINPDAYDLWRQTDPFDRWQEEEEKRKRKEELEIEQAENQNN
jgi:hypothetical protein